MTTDASITYSDELEDIVASLDEAGVVESRSAFFRDAAQTHLAHLLDTSALLGAVIEDADDIEDARQRLNSIRDATQAK